VPVTALPVEDEESFIAAPDELLSEECILPVSLAEPVPVTALPVADEELTDEESLIAELDEPELSQDAKQSVAIMNIKIGMYFMSRLIDLFLLFYIKTCPKNVSGRKLRNQQFTMTYLKFISVAILSAICRCICSLGRYLLA
jgi:hypothetical protein